MSEPDRPSGGTSYLVRLWREPSAGDPTRVYVRELRSGKEQYLKSIDALGDFLDRRQTVSAAADETQPEAGAGRRAG